MKVFLCWSGDLSRKVALELRTWLPDVIQAVEPYMSEEDITKGAAWMSELTAALQDSGFGILCVTQENVGAPWINFEGGALWKALDANKVCPLLIDLRKADVTGPLAQFQYVTLEKDDVMRLARDVNWATPNPLSTERLTRTFDSWWEKLSARLTSLVEESRKKSEAVPRRPAEDILEEILELVRAQQRAIEALASPITGIPPNRSGASTAYSSGTPRDPRYGLTIFNAIPPPDAPEGKRDGR